MTQVFRIKVIKWKDHNKNQKRSFKKSLIANNLMSDAKVVSLPVACRWLFVSLILLCGDSGNDTITITERQVNDILSTRLGARNALSLLEELQLVTVEILPLQNRRDMKLSDKKGREGNRMRKQPQEEMTSLLPPEAAPSPLVHPLMKVWNEHRGKLPECKSCVNSRLAKAKARWAEQTPDAWAKTIQRMAASDFCNGKNDRGWKSDFDFLLKADSWGKVNDGKYDNGTKSHTTRNTQTYDNLDRLREEWEAKGEAGK